MRKLTLPSDWEGLANFFYIGICFLTFLSGSPSVFFSWLCLVSSNYVVYLLKYIDVELKTGGTHAH